MQEVPAMFASTQNFTRTLAGAAGTLFFAGLCIAGATAPAQAQQPKAPISYSVNADGERIALVRYADINLNSREGQARLDTRLRIAARTVCSNGQQDPFATAAASRCFNATLRETRNSTMTAIASGKQVG
jgi:UrcA family protein